MKTKKRVLIDSWISALVCLVMMVGVCFAWFHTGNYVQADMVQIGELGVGLTDSDGTAFESRKLQWMTQNINYWEPGCTYYTEPFTVVNDGDLYFKYKLSMEGFSGDMELLDVITFHIYKYDTVNNKVLTDKAYEGVEVMHKTLDAGATYVLGGTMSKDAGNEYQGMKLRNATVVVNATQVNAGNAYGDVVVDNSGDVDLTKATQVANYSELKAAVNAATAEKPAVIVLTGDIEANDTITVKAPTQIYSFDDKKITLTANKILFNVQEAGSLYVEGVNFTASTNLTTVFMRTYGDLEMRECTVEGITALRTRVVDTSTGKTEATKYALIEACKTSDIVLTNVTFRNNECPNIVRDYYETTDDKVNNRADTATTKLQYCNVMNNKMTWMAYIRSNYSVAGGNISGNTMSNALFQVCNIKAAKLSLQYVTIRNNNTSGNQAAVAWVQSYGTLNINEGTIIEGNTASRSYGNIKAATKSYLNINGGTINPITFNSKGTATDSFDGIVNDNANIQIKAAAVIGGTHNGMAGYTSGSNWSIKAK